MCVWRIVRFWVIHRGPASASPDPVRTDVLFVQRFGLSSDVHGGRAAKRLHSASFIPDDDPSAFGFLDPGLVVRGCHLIPDFVRGRTSWRLALSIARRPEESNEDWDAYFVNMCVFHCLQTSCTLITI